MTEPIPLRQRRARLTRPRFETATLALQSGQLLAVEIRHPRGRAAGTAILLHPMMASRRVWNMPREQGFVSAMNQAGIRTLALDFRGHGESKPTPTRGASFGFDALVNEDIPAIGRAARERWGSQRLTIIGHSLGGSTAVASVATGACVPDALVLLATNVWLPSEEPNPVARAKKAAIAQACRALGRIVGHFPARALGAGSDDEPRSLMESWTGWWHRDRWTSDDGLVDYGAAMERITIPVLGVASLGDALLCPPPAAARFLKRLRSTAAELEVVRRADNGTAAPGHMELLTTNAAASFWRRVAAFCGGR